MLKQRQKDDEAGQLQRGITKGTKKTSFLPCFKDPVKCRFLYVASKLDQCSQERELYFKS